MAPAAKKASGSDVRNVDRETTERLRHAVSRLARLMRQQDEGGLGATVVGALATVKKLKSCTLGELAQREQVSPPTMTKVVEKLEKLGYVVRAADPADRRVTRVSITAEGRQYLVSTKHRRNEWLSQQIDGLSADQRESLTDVIEVLETLIPPTESEYA